MNNVPLDKLHSQGSLRIHEPSRQLRYSVDSLEDNDSTQTGTFIDEHLQPITTYKRGDTDILVGMPLTMKNQQLSKINVYEDNFCIGIAQDPYIHGDVYVGDAENPNKENIHIIESGKLYFSKKDLDNPKINKYMCFPPVDANNNFIWKKEDLNKNVYIDEWTTPNNIYAVDLTARQAAKGILNLICIGVIVGIDTYMENGEEITSKIAIDIEISNVNRSFQDVSEIHVIIDAYENDIVEGEPKSVIPYKSTDVNDPDKKLVALKTLNYKGYIIRSDEDIDYNSVYIFVANKNEDYYNKYIIAYKSVVLTEEFGYSKFSVGKDLYLIDGDITASQSTLAYNYRVGTILQAIGDAQEVLLSIGYPDTIKKFESIGHVKPLYIGNNCDFGYIPLLRFEKEEDRPNKVVKYYINNVLEKSYMLLAKTILHYNIAEFYIADVLVDVKETDTLESLMLLSDDAYFVFRDGIAIQYNLPLQIKYLAEGSPISQSILSPIKSFLVDVKDVPFVFCNPNRSPINDMYSLDITDLVELDYRHRTDKITLLNFQLTMSIKKEDSTNGISIQESLIKENDIWYGYSWKLVEVVEPKNSKPRYYIMLVTCLDDKLKDETKVIGICYPFKEQYLGLVSIQVRQRPLYYNDLHLNQLYSDSTWNADMYSDGQNLGISGSLYFGVQDGETKFIDIPTANRLILKSDYISAVNTDVYGLASLEEHSFGPVAKEAYKEIKRLHVKYNSTNYSQNTVNTSIETIYDFSKNIKINMAEDIGLWSSQSTAPDIFSSSVEKERIHLDQPRVYNALQSLSEIVVRDYTYDGYDGTRVAATHATQVGHIIPHDINTKAEIFGNVVTYFYKDEEINNIKNNIQLMYNNSWDDTDVLKREYSVQNIQNNLGMLTVATKETQTRLLKLETALFGIDYETIPGEQTEHQKKVTEDFDSLLDSIPREGVMRKSVTLKNKLKRDGFQVVNDINFTKNDMSHTHTASISVASPLSGFTDDAIPLHIKISPNGTITALNYKGTEDKYVTLSNANGRIPLTVTVPEMIIAVNEKKLPQAITDIAKDTSFQHALSDFEDTELEPNSDEPVVLSTFAWNKTSPINVVSNENGIFNSIFIEGQLYRNSSDTNIDTKRLILNKDYTVTGDVTNIDLVINSYKSTGIIAVAINGMIETNANISIQLLDSVFTGLDEKPEITEFEINIALLKRAIFTFDIDSPFYVESFDRIVPTTITGTLEPYNSDIVLKDGLLEQDIDYTINTATDAIIAITGNKLDNTVAINISGPIANSSLAIVELKDTIFEGTDSKPYLTPFVIDFKKKLRAAFNWDIINPVSIKSSLNGTLGITTITGTLDVNDTSATLKEGLYIIDTDYTISESLEGANITINGSENKVSINISGNISANLLESTITMSSSIIISENESEKPDILPIDISIEKLKLSSFSWDITNPEVISPESGTFNMLVLSTGTLYNENADIIIAEKLIAGTHYTITDTKTNSTITNDNIIVKRTSDTTISILANGTIDKDINARVAILESTFEGTYNDAKPNVSNVDVVLTRFVSATFSWDKDSPLMVAKSKSDTFTGTLIIGSTTKEVIDGELSLGSHYTINNPINSATITVTGSTEEKTIKVMCARNNTSTTGTITITLLAAAFTGDGAQPKPDPVQFAFN